MASQNLNYARTRAFARVLGPYLAIATAIIGYRAPWMGGEMNSFFGNAALVFITGAFMLFAGLSIIAFHQYWNGLAAILISVFGWFLTLRGGVLMLAPDLYRQAGVAAAPHMNLVRDGFFALTILGLYFIWVGWIFRPKAAAAPEG
jgi:hypothetical protein